MAAQRMPGWQSPRSDAPPVGQSPAVAPLLFCVGALAFGTPPQTDGLAASTREAPANSCCVAIRSCPVAVLAVLAVSSVPVVLITVGTVLLCHAHGWQRSPVTAAVEALCGRVGAAAAPAAAVRPVWHSHTDNLSIYDSVPSLRSAIHADSPHERTPTPNCVCCSLRGNVHVFQRLLSNVYDPDGVREGSSPSYTLIGFGPPGIPG